jgi:HTH-type transcriptional regulator, transcriptional repressor of NAD biosynthesis genes
MSVGRALLTGTFMPPHAGHSFAIDFMLGWTADVSVAIWTAADDPIDADVREAWLKELYPRVELIRIHTDEPVAAEERAGHLVSLGKGEWSCVFGSDTEDSTLAEQLNARFIPIDPSRDTVPVSATAIRDEPYANWEFLPACVRPIYVQRICIFGPAGSGKSNLAEQLAIHYDTTSALEYRAGFTAGLGRELQEDDLLSIATGQLASEDAMAKQANRVLFCDSNASSAVLEAELRFNSASDALRDVGRDRTYTLYLLMDVDGDWAMGSGKKPSTKATDAFNHYRQHLIEADLRYLRLDGDYDTRFRIACDAVDNLTGHPTARPPRPEYLRSA